MNTASLVDELRLLLHGLQLPIAITSPSDLTPNLLLAILESLLSSRLPLSAELRNAASSSRSKEAKNAKILCMKMLLGVIEADILKRDVGLNRIDPRKLANGDWDEVVYVGELLCWIGRESGVTEGHSGHVDAGELQLWRLSPSTVADTSTSHRSSSSRTTADTSASLHDMENLLSFQDPSASARLSPLSSRPRCIHEVPSPYTFDDSAISDSPSVRYTGYIQPVDEDFEIQSLEISRKSRSFSSDNSPKADRSGEDRGSRQWNLSVFSDLLEPDPQARTVTLLQERAFLLQELAKYHQE